MRKCFATAWAWIRSWFQRKPIRFRTQRIEELPDQLEPATIYIAGESEYLWFVAMICTCGCGETLHMNLQTDTRPRWSVTCHEDGTVSLLPSVWRKVGCRSHFFFREGAVVWCGGGEQ